ncbi:MAG: type II toxin-antitoxin system death-on-curing family toxin [Deltaproteobacteria bacterium]|jgi:death-on-curing protein|nr:type II toxin-antitoxin system death-on-curing family toxin [Deltaproteobacteria bacterium]
MICLSASEAALIGRKIAEACGGDVRLLDEGRLESAVRNCYQSFGEQSLYPGVIEKAARLAFGICRNHPLADGNKRLAVTSMLVFLRLNGIRLSFSQPELAALGLGLAAGSAGAGEVSEWIRSHLEL